MAKKSFAANAAGLRRWDSSLAILYVLEALVILVLGVGRSFPVTASFITKDPLQSQVAGDTVRTAASHHLFDINLTVLVVVFLLISAIVHWGVATRYRSQYETDLRKNMNRARWVELGVGGSLTLVSLAVVAGVQDAATLLAIVASVAVASLLGAAIERTKTGRLLQAAALVAGLLPWAIIWGSIKDDLVYGSGLPAYVWIAAASVFVLFGAAAINLYLQLQKKGKWADYFYGERMFALLSFAAKSVLAWIIFAGVLQP